MNNLSGIIIHKKNKGAYFFLLNIFIISAPLVVYGFSMFGGSVRISRILIIIILPLLLLKIMENPFLIKRDNFFLYAMLPYLIYTTISILWSPNVETGTGIQRLGGLYEIVIVYLIIIAADINAENVLKILKVYLISAIVPLGVGIWQIANNILQFSSIEIPFNQFVITGKYNELAGRYFSAGSGITRISSTFAEPNIFGCYLASVFLFSLLFKINKKWIRSIFRIFQLSILIVIIFTLSKLAYLFLIIGLLYITRKNKKYIFTIIFIILLMIVIIVLLNYYKVSNILNRLTGDSGHYKIFVESLSEIQGINYFIGAGIGSIPYGSWHRFIISRIYESGMIGLIFAFAVSIIPINIMRLKVKNRYEKKIKNNFAGVMLSTIIGLNAYDYFIHLWPWIVIGIIMSTYNTKKLKNLKRMRTPNDDGSLKK